MIVDTGSGVTAFPCSECNKCGVPDYHIDRLFSGMDSSTYRKLKCNECLKGDCRHEQCSMGMSYAEGSSWHAYEVSDLCYIGGPHDVPVLTDSGGDDLDPFHAKAFAFDLKFGCQTSITGLFVQQLADGIMGMDVAEPAFWWQMYNAGKISRKAFSMCFSRSDHVSKMGTVAGAMSMGGTDVRLHESPMIYSKVTSRAMGFYVVKIRKVYLREGGGGISAVSSDPRSKIVQLDISESSLNSQRVIVDSGTTDTYFTRRAAGVFEAAYKTMMGKAYDHKTKKFTPEELAREPTIILQLAGDEALNALGTFGLADKMDPDHPHDILVAIPPEHYYEFDEDNDGYVARFYLDENSGTVLGANAMMGHEVYFDIEGGTIGWSESSCDYTKAVAAYIDEKTATGIPPPGKEPAAEDSIPEIPPPGQEPNPSDDPDGVEPYATVIPPGQEPVPSDDQVDLPQPGQEPGQIDDPHATDPEQKSLDNDPDATGKDDSDDNTGSENDDEVSIAKVAEFDEIDDGKTNEEQSGHYEYDPQQICGGVGCQVGVLLAVIGTVVIAAVRISRRANRNYDNVGNDEMELQEDEFVNYRDKEFA